MKRSHEEDIDEVPLSKQKMEDSEILHDLHSNLLKDNEQFNNHVSKQLFETQKQYFTVYLQTLMDKIPMGSELVKIVQSMGGENEFEYTFTAAKSIINSQMKVSQIKTINAVFDMVYGLVGRYVHENIVTPTLQKSVSSSQLNMAFESYQMHAKAEDDKSILEMQCLLYFIQKTLEKEETIQIPNPMYSKITHLTKGLSEYILSILVSLATKHNIAAEDPKEYTYVEPKKFREREH